MANFVPILDIETMRQRESFARKHLELQVDNFWSSVVFSDEQRFM
jgi:hypothetical protein